MLYNAIHTLQYHALQYTLGLNEQEVYKNVSGVLLIVHKGFF